MVPTYALIFAGAGLGGVLRFWLGGAVQRWWGPQFPAGTLAVNITGCLLIGFLGATLSPGTGVREEYRLALMAGVLGGYTTFSAFGLETLTLIQTGHPGRAALNIALSVGAGLAAVWLGALLGHALTGRGG